MKSAAWQRLRHSLAGVSTVALVAAGLTLGAAPANAATITESEPNDTTATADALPLGTTVLGSILASNSSYEYDYYAIDVPAAGRVSFDLRFPGDLGTGDAYDFMVTNASGKTHYSWSLDGGDWDGSFLRGQETFLAAGRYYLRVSGSRYDASWGKQYSLAVTSTAGYVETEFNDTSATADALPLGKTIRGSILASNSSYEYDYYAIDVPAAGRVSFDLRFPADLGTGDAYDFMVTNASGKTHYSWSLDGGDWDGSFLRGQETFLAAGRYYLRVSGSRYDASWGKQYSLAVTSTAGYVETEFNDTSATADALPLGKTIRGSILAANSSYDDDYYVVDMPAPGTVGIDFRFPANLGSNTLYTLTVTSAKGDRLYAFDLNSANANGAALRGTSVTLPAGRSFIDVNGSRYDASWGKAYSLTVARKLSAATPKISGSPTVGSTLTVNAGTWSPAPVTLRYRWLRNGAAISGATASTYKVTSADAGKQLKVEVTGSKNGYLTEVRTSAAVSVTTPATVTRLSGASRYETSAAISKASFGAGVPVAYVANGATFPDALSGAPVAGMNKGPVLLVAAGSIPDAISAELKRLKPKKIVILGGNGAVSVAVQSQLKSFTAGSVTRLSGASRYETSAAISKASFGAGVPVAYVANGATFPDALSGAPVAGMNKGPVLLVAAGSIPDAISAELKRLKPKKIVILGGNGAVSVAVQSQLKSFTAGSVTRLSGASRYETSAAISKASFGAGVPVAYVANGATFPDALSGAPVAGMNKGPVLLVAAGSIPDAISAELKRLKPKKIVILGGAGAVSSSVENQLKSFTVR